MTDPKDPVRNRPTEEGRDNDPNVRDYSAIQPGVNTISSSDTDDANEKITKTGAEDFREETNDDDTADTRFDELGDKD